MMDKRVVAGQHLMQASSDIFLGWFRARPMGARYQDYYVRQLRDWKMSAVIEEMRPQSMQVYARLCGWTLLGRMPELVTESPFRSIWVTRTRSTLQ
jgi:uncharacterized protein DUF2252